ncbi:DUF6270 domain-containing protein [Psychrobacter celer]|uniref:DUF6270 domain-containing protein n=1 Tax=Psychrobacter celer TaxID=306572 RepID=UPI003FD3959F
MKFRVYGGCVSRDIFNFNDSDDLKVVGYNARSSLATLSPDNVAKKISDKNYEALSFIESDFQRRMVESDFNNSILESISNNNYDILLIDLMVDRFNLGVLEDKLITVSTSFALSKIKPESFIKTHSEQFLSEWYKGVENFLSVIDKTVGREKIKLNKIYWADRATDEKHTVEINKRWDVAKNNNKLNVLYSFLEKRLPATSIIEVSKELFIANPNHQWGLAPFHYTDDYYTTMVEILKND